MLIAPRSFKDSSSAHRSSIRRWLSLRLRLGLSSRLRLGLLRCLRGQRCSHPLRRRHISSLSLGWWLRDRGIRSAGEELLSHAFSLRHWPWPFTFVLIFVDGGFGGLRRSTGGVEVSPLVCDGELTSGAKDADVAGGRYLVNVSKLQEEYHWRASFYPKTACSTHGW